MSPTEQQSASGLPDDLPAELNILLGVHFLYWKTSEVLDAIGNKTPLSKNERSVILVLANPKRMGALAEQMQVLPSTITSLADELDAKGIVVRERSPDDRRAWRLRLTEKGIALRRDIVAQVAQMFSEVSGLTNAELELLSKQMLKIAQNIEAKGLPEGVKPCQP